MPSHGLVLALIVTGAGDDAMKTSEGCSPPPTPPTIPTWSPWRSSRTAMPAATPILAPRIMFVAEA